MAYTDPTLSTSIVVKKVHVEELVDTVTTIAANAKKSGSINLSGITYTKVVATNINLLRTAINNLETSFSGNCCQANCCQTCQTTKCQSTYCQSCQGCQTCQKCQTCQTCQKCQTQCTNCSNCDCGDDGV